MKQKWLLPYTLSCALMIGGLSCQKPVEGVLPESEVPPIVQLATVSLSGRVVDENNIPVAGASVSAGAAVKTTDVNGEFKFSNVLLEKNAAFIKVEKAGYFTGSRTLVASEQQVSYAEIELIPNKVIGTVNGASGGVVPVPSGGNIVFQSNSVVNAATKAAYSGNVSVAAFFLNPTAANFNSIMPGDLRGIRTNNEESGMQSFGMMAVELTGAGGEKLQLADGKGAVITFPIPAALQSQAPASIPLWYFDEVKGLWKEEGAATRQGSNYVGSVAHFSFWNVDAPFELVDFEAQIKDQNNQPLAFSKVMINTANDKISRMGYGITDAAGKVSGKIPSGQSLEITVYNSCNAVIYTKGIGTFTNKANLGTITVTNPAPASITFTGTAKDCNAAPITNGFVNISINGNNYRTPIVNGSFNYTVVSCNSLSNGRAQVFAYDITNNIASDSVLVTFSGTTAAPVDLTACANTATAFINYTLNGKDYAFAAPADSITSYYSNNTTTIDASIKNITNFSQNLGFAFNGNTQGTFPLLSLYVITDNKYYRLNNPINVTITQYDAANGFIAGSFSGNVTDSISTVPMSCTFKVKQ